MAESYSPTNISLLNLAIYFFKFIAQYYRFKIMQPFKYHMPPIARYSTVRLILWYCSFLFCSYICAEKREPIVFLESVARYSFCFFHVMESTGMWLSLAHSWKITSSLVVWVSTMTLTSFPPGSRMLKRQRFWSTPSCWNLTSSSSYSSSINQFIEN